MRVLHFRRDNGHEPHAAAPDVLRKLNFEWAGGQAVACIVRTHLKAHEQLCMAALLVAAFPKVLGQAGQADVVPIAEGRLDMSGNKCAIG